MRSIIVAAIIWFMACLAFIKLHTFYIPSYAIGQAVAGVLIWIGVMLVLAAIQERKELWKKG